MTNVADLRDALIDAQDIAEELLTDAEERVEKWDSAYEKLDEVASIIYGLDDCILLSRDEVHESIVTARNEAEGRRDEAYDAEGYYESIIQSIEDAVSETEYL